MYESTPFLSQIIIFLKYVITQKIIIKTQWHVKKQGLPWCRKKKKNLKCPWQGCEFSFVSLYIFLNHQCTTTTASIKVKPTMINFVNKKVLITYIFFKPLCNYLNIFWEDVKIAVANIIYSFRFYNKYVFLSYPLYPKWKFEIDITIHW